MGIVVKEPDQKDWELPEDGQYLGVIADVIDLGEINTGFGVKPKVQIKWLLDAYTSEGFQHQVSARYTASLHTKANLRKALKSILGTDVSGQFDLEELLGINNQLIIQQGQSEDGTKTYANIVAILKAPNGKRLEIPADFVRKADKEVKQPVKKAAQPQLKQVVKRPAPVQAPPPEEVYEEAEQEVVAPPPPLVKRAAGTIRQARTVTPAPAVAPTPAPRQARSVAAPAQTPIDGSDIPF